MEDLTDTRMVEVPNKGRKYSPNGNTGARTPNQRQTPIEEVKCWTCGKLGQYASDCTTKGPTFAFAPRVVRMNYLQDAQEDMDYAETAQDNMIWKTTRSLWRDPYYSSQGYHPSL